jgi:hypothetical protein
LASSKNVWSVAETELVFFLSILLEIDAEKFWKELEPKNLILAKRAGSKLRRKAQQLKPNHSIVAKFFLKQRIRARFTAGVEKILAKVKKVEMFFKDSSKQYGLTMTKLSTLWDWHMVKRLEYESYKEKEKQEKFHRDKLVKIDNKVSKNIRAVVRKASLALMGQRGDYRKIGIKELTIKKASVLIREYYRDKIDTTTGLANNLGKSLKANKNTEQKKLSSLGFGVGKNPFSGRSGEDSTDPKVIPMNPKSGLAEYRADARENSCLPYTRNAKQLRLTKDMTFTIPNR